MDRIFVSENKIDPSGSSVPALGYIHVYDQNSQISLMVYIPDLR